MSLSSNAQIAPVSHDIDDAACMAAHLSPDIQAGRPTFDTSVNSVTHPSGVTVYDDPAHPQRTKQLLDLISEYADVFTDTGFVNQPQDEWARVALKPDWQTMIPRHSRVYPLNPKNAAVVESTMDKLVQSGKATKTSKPTPLAFPVFVVWRTVGDKTKGRMVVDIRDLNKMTLPDSYPMTSQDEIMAMIAKRRAKYISIFDAISFYYQWRVHPGSRWAFTVNTPRGQFSFNCLVMGYKGSNAHVQRQMDTFLQTQEGAKGYCDDVVQADPDFHTHYKETRQLLSIFRHRNVSIGPAKSFVGFPTMEVLGRYVDGFTMTTTKEKIAAIKGMTFPTTLKELESFIGLVTWLRSNVPAFAIRMMPLQDRKTELLKTAPTDGHKDKQQRQRWTASIKITPTPEQQRAFDDVRDAIVANRPLHHYDETRKLFAEVDVSKNGIGAHAYHIHPDHLPLTGATCPLYAIQSVTFLSRTLSTAEANYWPTEMEMLGLVWILKKLRMWIESNRVPPVVIVTDHSAIIGLLKQPNISNTTAASAQNLRLVKAMEFVSGFELDVVHKPGKTHYIPDALSRVPSTNNLTPADAEGGLDAIFWAAHWAAAQQADDTGVDTAFVTSATFLSPTFRQRIIQGYDEDPFFSKTKAMLTANDNMGINAATLPFRMVGQLMYKNVGSDARLCT
ncbi:retrotransposable element [Ophiostoma piceae UAMH 11346]|uniref:Retrotransposable element n=1 Tax=Ophiostoma piceae (strain UAMH 11346) TaxID=1262450 RepID=S3CBB0_OPHP1|nr:retrotransposable element [Ophiostoma piceae UAMH 11346]